MMTQTRREILAVLSEILELDPDVRVGQLMIGMGVIGEVNTGRTLYQLGDEELLDSLCEHRNNLRKRKMDVAPTPLPGLETEDAHAPSSSAAAGQSQ
jgi:hypothetical protein